MLPKNARPLLKIQVPPPGPLVTVMAEADGVGKYQVSAACKTAYQRC
jgi:hypothetical protein